MMLTLIPIRLVILFAFCFQFTAQINAQELKPFHKEVNDLVGKFQSDSWQKAGVVFTGSSSIRMWHELDKYFHKTPIINTGFGGSKTKDLIIHLNELVLDFEPSKVFIYEGDNDVNSGMSTEDIIYDFEKLIDKLFSQLPDCHLYLISAKPSPSRWHLKEQFLEFNNALSALTGSDSRLTYIDVWHPMLDIGGSPKLDLFLEDNLHMNEKGYLIWKSIFQPYINQEDQIEKVTLH